MTKDEQARARLVEKATAVAGEWDHRLTASAMDELRIGYRVRAGFKDPRKGHFCAAGLTAAMEDAGLVVPAPGTPARRGAVALLDFVRTRGDGVTYTNGAVSMQPAGHVPRPGDIIAWKQNPEPEEWLWLSGGTDRYCDGRMHAFQEEATRSMCGAVSRTPCVANTRGPRCTSCVWETRKGHVALIVAVDDESLTTVGWNEGHAPGRVMKRRLWRDSQRLCDTCKGRGILPNTTGGMGHTLYADCPACKHPRGLVPRSSTVLYRRPGGLYGIARPVAR